MLAQKKRRPSKKLVQIRFQLGASFSKEETPELVFDNGEQLFVPIHPGLVKKLRQSPRLWDVFAVEG